MANENAEVFVSVRWLDGYLEEFIASEVRFGCDLLWMRLRRDYVMSVLST